VLGFSPTAKAKGRLAFAGYGITAPELKYDDYAGLDVQGKLVVVLRHTPRADAEGADRFDPAARSGVQSLHAPISAKIANAAARGAAGLVVVNDATTAAAKDFLPDYKADVKGMDGAPFPVLQVTRPTLDRMLQSATGRSLEATEAAIDKDLKPASRPLGGWRADVEVTAERTEFKVKNVLSNVVGYLDGSGPLANETVVIGAHYDHLGLGEEGRMGGKEVIGQIHHGADDNASGTAGVIELARRYGAAENRQGRRLVFVAFTGEERGLYGSVFYCRHPAFPIADTVAMLNLDMIGRTEPVPADWPGLFGKRDRLMIYGTGTADTFPKMVDRTTARHEFRVFEQASGYGPSDHASFYRYRVPVLFFYTGTHPEYHRPTDTADKINVKGMRKVVDLVQDFADQLVTTTQRAVAGPVGAEEDGVRGPAGDAAVVQLRRRRRVPRRRDAGRPGRRGGAARRRRDHRDGRQGGEGRVRLPRHVLGPAAGQAGRAGGDPRPQAGDVPGDAGVSRGAVG